MQDSSLLDCQCFSESGCEVIINIEVIKKIIIQAAPELAPQTMQHKIRKTQTLYMVFMESFCWSGG